MDDRGRTRTDEPPACRRRTDATRSRRTFCETRRRRRRGTARRRTCRMTSSSSPIASRPDAQLPPCSLRHQQVRVRLSRSYPATRPSVGRTMARPVSTSNRLKTRILEVCARVCVCVAWFSWNSTGPTPTLGMHLYRVILLTCTR